MSVRYLGRPYAPLGHAEVTGTATAANAAATLLSVGPFTPSTAAVDVDFSCAVSQSGGVSMLFEILLNGVVVKSGGFTPGAAGYTYPFAMNRRLAVTAGVATTIAIRWSPLQAQTLTCDPANQSVQFAEVSVWPSA